MLYSTLLEATRAGATVLSHFFNGSFTIENKEGKNNLVTEADHAAEQAIISVIQNKFPGHYILCEETGDIAAPSPYKWIIDPIDGTVNFAHGIPICCVSIALEYEGEVIMGAVYNPLMNEFFTAEKGKGAFLNGAKIKVSSKKEFLNSCLVTGFPYAFLDTENGPLKVFSRLLHLGLPVRRLGSAALDLCWVAAGRFDGFYEHSLQPWDSAAGFLIVLEAGGLVTHLDGSKYSPYKAGLVATNQLIHQDLMAVINEE